MIGGRGEARMNIYWLLVMSCSLSFVYSQFSVHNFAAHPVNIYKHAPLQAEADSGW